MVPNHHFATHIPDQILDFGPVYGFWCFLNERLNKLFKQYNVLNWDHGKLEISLMRALNRDISLNSLVCAI